MKNALFLLIIFCSSCAIRKLQRPTAMTDLKTGATIKKNSIHLEKGKICYIYSTPHEGQVIDKSIFKNVNFSSFFPTNGVSIDDLFNGGASRSAKIDTVINNSFIDEVILQEALKYCPMGFQYQYVPQQEFVGNNQKPNLSILDSKFDPDIIINLKDVSLKIIGDANTAYSEVRSEPRNINYGLYASSTTSVNSYGNILMDYTAVWVVKNIEGNKKQSIKQTGRYVSTYYDGYSINKEIMKCAKKIGGEFSGLFKNSYQHVY